MMDKGPELNAYHERRTEKWAKQREAWDKIQEVFDEYNADPWQIPIEQSQEFRSAAQLIIDTSENDPDFNPKPGIINLAKEILKILPAEQASDNPDK